MAGGGRVSGTRHESRDVPPHACPSRGCGGKAPDPAGPGALSPHEAPEESPPQQSLRAAQCLHRWIRVEGSTARCLNPRTFSCGPVPAGVPIVVTGHQQGPWRVASLEKARRGAPRDGGGRGLSERRALAPRAARGDVVVWFKAGKGIWNFSRETPAVFSEKPLVLCKTGSCCQSLPLPS